MGPIYDVQKIIKKSESDLKINCINYIPPQATEIILNAIKRYIPLENRVNVLEGDIEIVKEKISQIMEIVEPKGVDNLQAKEKIITLYKTTYKPLYYVDIAEILKLPLRQVVKIVEELLDDGLVEEVTE